MIGDIRKFKFWCQKVLPLVYDDSLSYYEVLCKVVQYLNKVIEDVNSIPEYIDGKIEEALTDEHIIELLSQFIAKIQSAISANNEGTNTNASKDYSVGQMLWLNDTLYRVIRPIDAGDTLIVDTNIEAVDFETLFNDFVDEIKHDISSNDDGTNATASQSWDAGQWLWLDDKLYRVVSNITQGNAYVFSGDNANVEEITIEEMLIDEAEARTEADALLQEGIDNNAVARSFVFPEDYGAVGDGVTDDLLAFNTAISDVVSNNLKLIIPHKQYKLSEYIFTDDEYIINFGIYPDKKIITSNKLPSGSFKKISSKLLFTDEVFGLDHEVQAGLWNEASNCFTLFAWDMSNTAPSHCYITNVDTNFNVLTQYDFTYGLFNDACYFNKANSILATGSVTGSDEWGGKLVELNPTTFAVTSTHDTGIAVIYEVSYDADNELIYVAGRDANDDLHWYISVLDTNFNILKTIPIEFNLAGYNEVGLNFNKEGSAFIKNNFMFQSFCDGNLIINTFNLETGKVKQYYAEPLNERFVVENIFTKGNLMYAIGYQGRYSLVIETYDINTISTNSNWAQEQIVDMKSNTDLNDLEMDSMYVCYGGALTSVTHAPVNQPFIIKTFRMANVYIAQMLVTQIGQVYWRGTTTAAKVYTGWKQIAGASNFTLYSTDVLYGYMYDNSTLRMSVRLPYVVNGYRASITINRLIIYLEDTVVDLTEGFTVSTPTQTATGLTFNIALASPVTISHRYQPVCVNLSAALTVVDD